MCSACSGNYENPEVEVLDDDVREERRRIELGNVREAYLRGFYLGEPGLETNEEIL